MEHIAIDAARTLLASGDIAQTLDVPLGPEIGQCCGGRVEVSLNRMTQTDRDAAIAQAETQDAADPAVYILGAGHVGRELANLFQHMPVKTVLIDQRAGELAQCHAEVEKRQSAIPEFRHWCLKQCDGLTIDNLICPIGAGGSRDKRPAVIAAFVAAEVITALTSETAATAPHRGTVTSLAAQ